ncbi:MAG: DUF3891 family protein [Synechococcales bacterium]|nr:DUF3891 family protein [Synechococcales bacterium]
MIVNLQADGWEVIYHRAHALLAAQIAGNWDYHKAPQRLYETIAAISHHDDLEKEWEGDHLTPAGAPMDFTLEQGTSVEKMRRHIAEAVYRSRWVALLLSMHLCFLTQGRRGSSPEIDEFLDEQEALQTRWRDELDVSQPDADAAYAFMRWCDRLSLILCQHKIPMAQRSLEITAGPDGKTYYIHAGEDGALVIKPWPFVPERFEINVEACRLSQLQFDQKEELTVALQEAPRQVLTWTLAQGQA